jgi:hypothetical protein
MFSEKPQPSPLPKNESMSVVDVDKTQIIEQAKQLGHKLFKEGFGHTGDYAELVYSIVNPDTGQMKPESEIDSDYVLSIINKINTPPPFEVTSEMVEEPTLDTPDDSSEIVEVNNYKIALQDRVFTEPVQPTSREVSKQYLSKERQKLAEEIKSERRANRERLADIHVKSLDLAIDLNQAEINIVEA